MSDITPKSVAAPSGVMPPLPSAAPAAPNTATAAEIPAAVANLSVGTFITGTVIERNPRGMVVLRTDKGTIKLQTPVPLKPGSTVTLQIQTVGAQVQLSILSIDGQPLATASGKPAATPARSEGAGKTPTQPDASPARTQSSPTNSTSHPATVPESQDGAATRAIASDRLATDRSTPARPVAGQMPAPAGSFVARPLAQINSAGLEALSSPSVPSPSMANSPVRATPMASAVIANTMPAGAQTSTVTSQGAAAGATPGLVPTPLSSDAPELPTAMIAPGSRFAASFVAAPLVIDPRSANNIPTTAATPTAPPSLVPPAAPSNAAHPATAPATLPTDRVVLRLLGMEAPTSAPANPASPPAPPGVAAGLSVAPGALTTIGTIVGGDEIAHLVPPATAAAGARTWIATPFGLLSAAGPAPGPAGTQLLLEILLQSDWAESVPSTVPASGAAMASSSQTAAVKPWPVLRDIMAAVQAVAPEAAERLTNITLPHIGPNLATGMMAFVGALRQGNPRTWLGEQTVDSLQRAGHGALLERLADDFAVVTRHASETSPHGWQTLLLPLYDGDQLQQLRLYWQRQRRKPNQRQDSTRFVVEAELTKLGTLQLDGIFNKPQFDLVVRTSTSLPAQIRGDIIEIFGDALLATNLKGAVSFQTNVALRPGPPPNDDDSGIGLIV